MIPTVDNGTASLPTTASNNSHMYRSLSGTSCYVLDVREWTQPVGRTPEERHYADLLDQIIQTII
jgi:hypothetical protein